MRPISAREAQEQPSTILLFAPSESLSKLGVLASAPSLFQVVSLLIFYLHSLPIISCLCQNSSIFLKFAVIQAQARSVVSGMPCLSDQKVTGKALNLLLPQGLSDFVYV